LLIIPRCGDAALEPDVPTQIKLVGHIVEVAQDFRLLGIPAGPLPFLQDFLGEGIAVEIAFGVASRAGIPVPVPRPADPVGSFVDARRKPEFAQPVEHVEARKARADDDRV
jgi:hypothetical protein